MPTTHPTNDSTASHANDLYWNSAQTVEGIMTDLGLSKNALYSSIEPRATGRSCITCGGSLVFTNRTSRDAGRATCAACGLEAETFDLEESATPLRDFGDGGASHASHSHSDGRWGRIREDLASVEPERVALVGGAAALGVMIGAAAARAVREIL